MQHYNIPHVLIALFFVYMLQTRYVEMKKKDSFKAISNFKSFLVGYIILVCLLVWSWL